MKPILLFIAALLAACVSCSAQVPIISQQAATGYISGVWPGQQNLYYALTAAEAQLNTNGGRVYYNCQVSSLTLLVSAPSTNAVPLPAGMSPTIIVDMTISNGLYLASAPVLATNLTTPGIAANTNTPAVTSQ